MDPLLVALILATFLCSLVAGFLFAFAVVAMPGMKNLRDREFIHAFQGMDGVIQRNQPIFMLVWVGSIIALLASVGLGIGELERFDRLLLIAAALAYLVGVQVPTITINIPLNHRIQSLDVDRSSEAERSAARAAFEARWNRWNVVRAWISSLVSALLIVLLTRI